MKDDKGIVYSTRIPSRVVKSRYPSPVAKSGLSSTYEDTTVEQHIEDFRRFINADIFMYDIDAPVYSNKPDKIRPKLNFEYKKELLDNKLEEKIDQ
jgi:hypothetical protein